MNKISAVLFSSLMVFSSLSQAGALVGDWAEYQLTTVVRETGEKKVLNTRETVLSFKKDDYIIWYEEIVNGTSVVAEERSKTRLMGVVDGQNFVDSCDYLGVLEDITVSAGSFESCKSSDRELVIWYAAVPFGKVKFTYTLQTPVNGGIKTTDGAKELMKFGHK